MKNVRVKVTKSCAGYGFWFGIYDGRKELMTRTLFSNKGWGSWSTKDAATRNAKAMAKHIGIKYDPKIIKQHGC